MVDSPRCGVKVEKFVVSADYARFLAHLRTARRAAGLTQQQVATRLGQTQSFVSKCERGERRIDVIELRTFCRALNTSFSEFVQQLDVVLSKQEH